MENQFAAHYDQELKFDNYGSDSGQTVQHRLSTRIEERVGRGICELLTLESAWRGLSGALSQPRFIHTFEWQLAYLQHLEPNPEAVHYISYFVDGQAIAIFPLRRSCRSVGRLQLRLWELPSHPHMVLGDPLVLPEWATGEIFKRLLKTLDQISETPWDALHLPNLLEDSISLGLLRLKPPPRTHLETSSESMWFPCTDMNAALANCSSAFKRNLRRQGKKLAQQGMVTLTLARAGTELDGAFSDFIRLEASGWKGGNGKASAIGLHPQLLGFYGELKDRFAYTGNCLISLLKLNGVVIAAQFCLLAGNTLYIQKIAYDETWHAEGPGHQLLYKLLEYCCSESGIHHLSLVTSPAWALGRWNPQSLQVWESYIFKPNSRGLWGLLMRRLKYRFGKMRASPQKNGRTS